MFAKSVAVVALFFTAAVSGLNIATPSGIKECQDVEITYGDGAPKYLLAVVPGKEPCAEAIKEFPETSETKQIWKANLPAGTSVMFVVEDAETKEAWSGEVVISEGDKSCLPKIESAPPAAPSPAQVTPPPAAVSKAPTTTPPKVASPGGVANVEAGSENAATSSFVISSAAVAGVIGAAALLL